MARSSDSFFLMAILKDKTFQAREIRRVLLLSLMYLVITTAMLGIFYYQIIGNLVDGIAPLFFVSEDMQLVNEAVPAVSSVLAKWIGAMMLVNIVVTIALGIYITRKLGHPLLAIKRTLREVGNGNLDVRLRESDNKEFGEISSALTEAMASVREQISAAKLEINQANEAAQQPNQDKERSDQALKNCKLALDYFQVDQAANDQSKAA